MAEKSALARKIDTRLQSIRGQLDALGEHSVSFSTVASGDRGPDWDALEAEWRDTLHRLEWLHEQFTDGRFSPKQTARHQHNLAVLKQRLPLLLRLGLAVPGGVVAASLEAESEFAGLA